MSLWKHQEEEIARHTLEPGRFLFWDPRVGKTRAIVYEIAIWIKQGLKRILVVAPLDGCKVWLKPDELGMFDPQQVQIVNLSTDETIAGRANVLKHTCQTHPMIVVVNRDVIFKERVIKGNEAAQRPQRKLSGLQTALQRWGPEALILDESHDYRKISSKRSRAAEALAKGAKFRRGLSGTPDPRSYIDFYAQYKIIAPHVFGTRKADFIERYCNMSFHFPNKVDSYKNVGELREKIFSVASRVEQKDCFDMPDVLPDIFVDVAFNRLARELYDELTENLVAEFLGLEIDATHQLSKLTVLHQLAQGFVRDGHGNPEWISDGKIKAAHTYIEEMLRADKRVVVYHHYTPEGQRLYEECVKRYGRNTVGKLSGDTPRAQRSPHPFSDRRAMRIFVAQEETAQLAISLREADHVLWISWGSKADVYYQARQRIFDERANKPHGLSYTFLRTPHTADATMTQIVARKRNASKLLLDYGFRRLATGDIP